MILIWVAVILLGVLAIADLVVGVSNDAVNFLLAAIGSKVARRRFIYWIASAGLLIGAMLSAGMMEVARNGVIVPSSFSFTELMVVFFAVMLTDIVLIDGFNTLGFPTSTTIAVVFELLGGALALSIIKKGEARLEGIEVQQMINTDKAFVILAGILLSIFLSFVLGIVIQFITRVIFTFKYRQKFKILFSLVGGLAITSIVFMISKKVLSGASLANAQWITILNNYFPEILMGVFAFFTFIFLFLSLSFNTDIPRLVVFFGTFALAMSFAANDLVNFIGIPLAAIQSFRTFLSSGATDPNLFPMDFLENNYLSSEGYSNSFFLIVAVLSTAVMVVTLFISKKAKGVTETEVYLGKQTTGYERFEPSHLSRALVRNFLNLHAAVNAFLPSRVVDFFDKRYQRPEIIDKPNAIDGVVFFDTIRASVNLVVASLLISIGTYMRFPLSTTLVVFMVAMGTSLADQAWGRESAVYRISGVLSILGGWFFTACLAFIGAFILVFAIWYGGWIAMIALTGLVAFILYSTTRYFNKKLAEKKNIREEYQDNFENSMDYLLETGSEQIRRNLLEASKIYLMAIQGFIDEDVKQLHDAQNKAEILEKYTRNGKSQLFYSFARVTEEGVDSGQYFIQAFDYLSELVACMKNITQPLYEHIENHHKGMTLSQKNDMQELLDEVSGYFNLLIHLEKEKRFNYIHELIAKQNFLLGFQDDIRKNQIKRIQSGEGRTRVSILFMDVLSETKNVLLYSLNLLKAHRDFVTATSRMNTGPEKEIE